MIVRAILKDVDVEDNSMVGVYIYPRSLEDIFREQTPRRIIS
jgi:hypothetical protein